VKQPRMGLAPPAECETNVRRRNISSGVRCIVQAAHAGNPTRVHFIRVAILRPFVVITALNDLRQRCTTD
jgi:hypothetical protein